MKNSIVLNSFNQLMPSMLSLQPVKATLTGTHSPGASPAAAPKSGTLSKTAVPAHRTRAIPATWDDRLPVTAGIPSSPLNDL